MAAGDAKRIEALEKNHRTTETHISDMQLKIGVIGKGVSGLEADISSQSEMLRGIAAQQNRPPEKTNWNAFIASAGVVLALVGIYFNQSLKPYEAEDFRARERHDELAVIVSERDKQLAALIVEHDAEHDALLGRVSSIEATQEYNVKIRDQAIVVQTKVIDNQNRLTNKVTETAMAAKVLGEYLRLVDHEGTRRSIARHGHSENSVSE